MKSIIVIVFGFFLAGCTAETPPNKDPNMLKGTPENYVIFSPMEGVLLKGGNPLPNVKIIRTLKWNGNDEGTMSEFVTDEVGRFSIPIHEEKLSLGMLSQFVGKTKLIVEFNGENIVFWYNNKFTPEIYAETDGPISELGCDIDLEEITVRAGQSTILTKCRWKNMPVDED